MKDSKRKEADKVLYLQLGTSILGAGVFLLVFEAWLNDFVAMPLRVLSTAISKFIVSLCGYDVIQEGTSLVVGTFRFNVDLACSGSQTLQQMLAAAIVLAGIWGGLSLVQKALAVIIAVPIALLTNGLRVSGLMLASLYAGQGLPEETFAHQFIGILAFALALLLFWQVCRNIGRVHFPAGFEGVIRLVLYLLLLLLVFFPFLYNTGLSWLGSEWNPYNRYAWVFVVMGLVLFGFRHYYKRRTLPRARLGRKDFIAGLILTAAGAGWAVVVIRLGFVTVQGAGLLAVLCGCLILALGFRGFLREIPIVVLLVLSFPRLPLVLSELLSGYSGYDWGLLFGVRLALSGVLALVYLRGTLVHGKIQYAGGSGGDEPCSSLKNADRRWLGVYLILLLVGGGGLLWQGYQQEGAVVSSRNVREYSLLTGFPQKLGVWQGEEVTIRPATRELLGGRGAVLAVYTSDYALPVEFFYNYSGGDRHNLHPPEYCLTGAGWKIIQKKSLKFTDQKGRSFSITVMELLNGGEVRWFGFWFYDGVSIQANYMRMLAEDLLARLGGVVREWSVYRIIAYREEDLRRFIEALTYEISVPVAEGSP